MREINMNIPPTEKTSEEKCAALVGSLNKIWNPRGFKLENSIDNGELNCMLDDLKKAKEALLDFSRDHDLFGVEGEPLSDASRSEMHKLHIERQDLLQTIDHVVIPRTMVTSERDSFLLFVHKYHSALSRIYEHLEQKIYARFKLEHPDDSKW